jgi:Transposase, Mutator family
VRSATHRRSGSGGRVSQLLSIAGLRKSHGVGSPKSCKTTNGDLRREENRTAVGGDREQDRRAARRRSRHRRAEGPLSELARLGAKLIIQRAVEEELDAWLGRARYERRPEAEPGKRDGYRPRRLRTAEGELEVGPEALGLRSST